MPALKVPVSPDFFHCPPLSAEDVQHFQAIGAQAAYDLVDYTRLVGGPIDWTFHTTDDKVKLFRSRQDNVLMFCAHTEIEATLEEIIPHFLTVDTDGVRGSAFAFFPDIIDMVRLYNIELPSVGRPHRFLGINWCLLSTPMMVKHRDLCYLELQEEVLIGGKRAWIRALTHVDVAACPELPSSYGIVRGKMIHSGFIYMECDRPGILQVFELEHVMPNGRIRGAIGDFLVTKSAESQCHSLNALQHKVRAAQLSQLQFLPDHVVVPYAARTSCVVCLKKFGAFQRRDNCRRCGEVVCRQPCSATWSLVASGLRVRVRLCEPCSAGNTLRPNGLFERRVISRTNASDVVPGSSWPMYDSSSSSVMDGGDGYLHECMEPPCVYYNHEDDIQLMEPSFNQGCEYQNEQPPMQYAVEGLNTIRTGWITQQLLLDHPTSPTTVSETAKTIAHTKKQNTPVTASSSSSPFDQEVAEPACAPGTVTKMDLPFGMFAVTCTKEGKLTPPLLATILALPK
ncbi:Aste57867_23646 [Aphanomyces stellatus]|uniref:Aste57867_23646 protein n=1 Tax=Aphanomyces stellatus TaxID=120398 RepID=A0A485LNF5_9STRA|nr:hypothetical protein As57867_023574 [Aphanomyces stellatus]VFU00291.1 Aste57867_23646 [Aphanomyces stellatus]